MRNARSRYHDLMYRVSRCTDALEPHVPGQCESKAYLSYYGTPFACQNCLPSVHDGHRCAPHAPLTAPKRDAVLRGVRLFVERSAVPACLADEGSSCLSSAGVLVLLPSSFSSFGRANAIHSHLPPLGTIGHGRHGWAGSAPRSFAGLGAMQYHAMPCHACSGRGRACHARRLHRAFNAASPCAINLLTSNASRLDSSSPTHPGPLPPLPSSIHGSAASN